MYVHIRNDVNSIGEFNKNKLKVLSFVIKHI